jgi:hypothetical protein
MLLCQSPRRAHGDGPQRLAWTQCGTLAKRKCRSRSSRWTSMATSWLIWLGVPTVRCDQSSACNPFSAPDTPTFTRRNSNRGSRSRSQARCRRHQRRQCVAGDGDMRAVRPTAHLRTSTYPGLSRRRDTSHEKWAASRSPTNCNSRPPRAAADELVGLSAFDPIPEGAQLLAPSRRPAGTYTPSSETHTRPGQERPADVTEHLTVRPNDVAHYCLTVTVGQGPEDRDQIRGAISSLVCELGQGLPPPRMSSWTRLWWLISHRPASRS